MAYPTDQWTTQMVLLGSACLLVPTTSGHQSGAAKEGLRTNVYPPRGNMLVDVRHLCVSLHEHRQCDLMHHGRRRFYITGKSSDSSTSDSLLTCHS